jgi:hypothetical protein
VVLNLVMLHSAGDGALRRRLIKLLSAGWVPPSVSAYRGWSWSERTGVGWQRGHVVRDRGSPPWLHPRRYAAEQAPAVSA